MALLQHSGDDADGRVEVNKIHKRYGTPLQLAAEMGRGATVEVIGLLLTGGAKLRSVGGKFGTPLHAAALGPYYSDGYRAWWRVSGSKQIEVLQRLLQDDEDAVHIVAGKFATVLQAAAAGGATSVVEFLIGLGCGRTEAQAISGACGTALHAALSEKQNAVAMFLLNKTALGFSLETVDGEGRLPTHISAMRGDEEAFHQLLSSSSRGDDLELLRRKDIQGRTTLHFAVMSGSTPLIKFLLDRDAALLYEKDDDGWTPLHWASRALATDFNANVANSCTRLLIERDAKKGEFTKRGWLPRDVAAWHE
jgi:hypothetical protein